MPNLWDVRLSHFDVLLHIDRDGRMKLRVVNRNLWRVELLRRRTWEDCPRVTGVGPF